jgi:hypothetical protein
MTPNAMWKASNRPDKSSQMTKRMPKVMMREAGDFFG